MSCLDEWFSGSARENIYKPKIKITFNDKIANESTIG